MTINCISIQAGGLLIAVTDMVLNLFALCLSAAIILYQVCFQIKCRTQITDSLAEEIQRQYQVVHEDELKETIEPVFWSLILFIMLCNKQIAFNSVLIHGIRKNDLRKVRIWLVFKACIVVLGIVMILTQDSIGQGVYRQISEILYVFLTLFFMCIIFILYDVMHRRRHQLNSNRLVNA